MTTEYQKLLDAVADYYGSGSDEWVTIATSAGYKGEEWANIVRQVPGVNINYNKNGDILSYTVDNAWGTAADSIGGVVDSNTQTSQLAGMSTAQMPANTTITQSNTVAAESGMKAVGTGAKVSTVVADVALGVMAVGTGVQLGAAIDSTLYNLNPEFWNEQGLRSLDPQTWDSICSTKGGKTVFNMVFGIDKSTQKTQAYVDERALAYIAAYMASAGAFDPPSTEIDYTEIAPSIDHPELMPDPLTVHQGSFTDTHDPNYPDIYTFNNGVSFALIHRAGVHGVDVIAGSKTPFTYNWKRMSGGSVIFDNTYDSSAVTYHGQNFYNMVLGLYALPNQISLPVIELNHAINITEISFAIAYGDLVEIGGVEGISRQDGGTFPSGITTGMTIPAVLALLQQQYPGIFSNGIYNDVIQPDGTVARYTYVPVGIPDNVPYDLTDEQVYPVGGSELTQANPTIDPTQIPESVIETLLKILTSTDPDNPTQTPTDVPPDDYPDTGEGNTPVPVVPTGSASALYSIYNPSQLELNDFGAWLWSPNFVDQLLKLFNDPMQAIIGLHKVFATPPTSGTGNIKVGYLSSGVSSKLVSSQYTEVDCGNVSLKEYFGNALDYTDTDVYIYLPFIGIIPLNTVDIMRATIEVKYKVDVLTGACLAMVNVFRDNNAGGQLYSYSGNCAVQYPLSSGSYMGIVTSVAAAAGSIAGTIITGGAAAPVAIGATIHAASNAKTKISHSSSLSGNAGAMGIKKPYLIIRRPQTKIADNFKIFNGESNNVFGSLGSFTGFVKATYIHIENSTATSEEMDMIESIVKDGVLI